MRSLVQNELAPRGREESPQPTRMEFVIPARPEDLVVVGEGLTVENAADYSGVPSEDLTEVAEGKLGDTKTLVSDLQQPRALSSQVHVTGVAYDLCENDALCITEQHILDGVYSLLRWAMNPVGLQL